jgi:hypothetical protein
MDTVRRDMVTISPFAADQSAWPIVLTENAATAL